MKPYQDRKSHLETIFALADDMAGSFRPDVIEAHREVYRTWKEEVIRELRALRLIEEVLTEEMTAEQKVRMINHILISECQ